MAKTAEDSLSETIINSFDSKVNHVDAFQYMYCVLDPSPAKKIVTKAMREFAAQEVEAYKERLKKEIERGLWDSNDIEYVKSLIDAVK